MAVSITSNSTPSTQALTWNGSTFAATWSHTTASGDDQLVAILTGTVDQPDAVKWNGVSLTQRAVRGDGSAGGVLIYDLDSPAIGAYSLQITRAASSRTYNVCILALSGVDVAGTPRGTAGTSFGTSGTAIASATVAVGDLVIGAATTINTATPNGGQSTLIDDSSGGGEYMQIGYKTATGTSESLTWTQTSGVWGAAVIGYKPSGGGSLTITSVNTTNTAFSAQTDSAVIGTGLSASVVCTYAGIACTNESASSSTSLKITFPDFFTNNIKLGRNYEFKVVG